MTKKDRVVAAIMRKPVDYVPSGFSLHFPPEEAHGDRGIESHIKFFQETDTDICKVMNENLVPAFGSIRQASDYKIIPAFNLKDSFIQAQVALTGGILDRLDSRAFTMGTLHGILASSIHPLEQTGMPYEETRKFLVAALRSDPTPVLDAMNRISDAMCLLVGEYARLGIDSIYYAGLGAERHYFTDEEFSNWIEPFDHKILEAIKEAKVYSFLHICKENLNMNRYASYTNLVDVVNWGVYEAPFSLKEGKTLFKNTTIMGGLPNRSGVLVDGDGDAVGAAVEQLINEMGTIGYILGADCTLATEQDLSLVRSAVQACRMHG